MKQCKGGTFTVNLIGILSLITLLLLVMGCGQNSQPSLGNEQNWEVGQGDLSSTVGNQDNAISPPYFLGNSSSLWEQTDYHAPTGQWFLHNDGGIFGYGLTSGTQQAGGELFVSLYAHGDEEEGMDRDVRIQLTAQENMKVVKEKIVHVETVTNEQKIYKDQLPDTENISYILSVEVLNKEGKVEDTLLSSILVPKHEINATLSTEQTVYKQSDDEVTLILNNYGPTVLSFGKYYTLEKRVDGTWRRVPLVRAFEDIGINLTIDKRYEQTVEIDELNVGQYRIIKEIRVDGLDLIEELAAEFGIESN